jgi:predicted nucleic acid-binding protein
MYLVDTDVISAASPSRVTVSTELAEWMDRNSERLFVSAISVAEIEDGIAKSRREGARGKSVRLEEWLETLLHLYRRRILPFDVPAARIAGKLSDLARSKGQDPGFADLGIAATAAAHDLIVLTRNLRHFAPLEIPVHNPFESLP